MWISSSFVRIKSGFNDGDAVYCLEDEGFFQAVYMCLLDYQLIGGGHQPGWFRTVWLKDM